MKIKGVGEILHKASVLMTKYGLDKKQARGLKAGGQIEVKQEAADKLVKAGLAVALTKEAKKHE